MWSIRRCWRRRTRRRLCNCTFAYFVYRKEEKDVTASFTHSAAGECVVILSWA